MKKKRILFMIDSLDCGGAERSLVSLLSALACQGTQLHLMVTRRGGVFEQYVPDNVTITGLPKIIGIKKIIFKLSLKAFSLKLRLLRLLSIRRHGAETYWGIMHNSYPNLKDRYDVAIAYQQGFPSYYVSEKVNAGKKIAWINTDMLKAGYRPRYNRKVYDRYDRVVGVSDTQREQLCSDGFVSPDKISTIYDIHDEHLIREMAKEHTYIDRSSITLRLTTVGRMEPVKNYTLAIETARELKLRGVGFEWTLIGDGSERRKIEGLIRHYNLENEIHLKGMLPNPYPYIAHCDIYVNTSLFEGFGLTLTEARILFKPVISTDIPTARLQIKDGINGLIVQSNPKVLAEALLRLWADKDLYGRIIDNIRRETNDTSIVSRNSVNALLYD